MSYTGPLLLNSAGASDMLEKSSLLVSGRTQIEYRPQNFVTQNQNGDPREWRLWRARRSRQAIQWCHYEGTLYDAINVWVEELKQDKSLYEFVRHIYSPAHRLGEFWATHVFGGALDPNAGDGSAPHLSAIPIMTTNQDLRPAIAQVWAASNWQVHKETMPRFGAVMGDVGLTVEDDPQRQIVKIKVVDPRIVYDVDEDTYGNCRGYVFKQMMPDPLWDVTSQSGSYPVPYVEYMEWCRRQGDMVVYETFRDGVPFDWADPDRNGRERRGARWTEGYGFVPFVRVQHKNLGLGWGMAELDPSLLSKLYELDDQASKFCDYVRKAVDSPWLFSGVNAEDVTLSENTTRTRTGDAKGEGRQRVPILYAAEPGAKAQPLIAPLDLPAVMANIQSILRMIEQEHPELTADLALASGDASGRALRVAREKAEALVVQRRATYDDALRRAHQMAISIAGQKQYPGYEAFNERSFVAGKLDHQIGSRAVFALNVWDQLEEELERGKVVDILVKSGVPLVTAWRRAGYREDQIAEMERERVKELDFKLKQIQVLQVERANDGASYGIGQ